MVDSIPAWFAIPAAIAATVIFLILEWRAYHSG